MLRFTKAVVASYSKVTPARFALYTPQRTFMGFGGDKNAEKTESTESTASSASTEAPVAEKVEEVPTQDPELVSLKEELANQKKKAAEQNKMVEELKAKVHRAELGNTELNKKLKELQERVLSEINEQDLIRERAKKEIENIKVFGISSFCKKLLEVNDTLEMALDATNKSIEKTGNEEVRQFAEGIIMTQKTFEKVLGDVGVKKYVSMGEKADPNFHDVSAQIPDPTKEPGTISFVIKEGYTIQDRVLRPAQVVAVMEQ